MSKWLAWFDSAGGWWPEIVVGVGVVVMTMVWALCQVSGREAREEEERERAGA